MSDGFGGSDIAKLWRGQVSRLLSWRLVFVVVGSLLLMSCSEQGPSAADISSDEAVNIRIENASSIDFDSVRLGNTVGRTATTFNTEFVDIGVGEVSEYLPVEPITDNYETFSARADGETHNLGFFTEERTGMAELSAGSFYTFTLIDGEAAFGRLTVLEVTIDR